MLARVYACQNDTLLEITCRGLFESTLVVHAPLLVMPFSDGYGVSVNFLKFRTLITSQKALDKQQKVLKKQSDLGLSCFLF